MEYILKNILVNIKNITYIKYLKISYIRLYLFRMTSNGKDYGLGNKLFYTIDLECNQIKFIFKLVISMEFLLKYLLYYIRLYLFPLTRNGKDYGLQKNCILM